MKQKILAWTVVGVLVGAIAGVVWWSATRPTEAPDAPSATIATQPTVPSASATDASDGSGNQVPSTPAAQTTPAIPTGFYGPYGDDRLTKDYATTVLFFHAPWCSECRAFERAIQAGSIPAGIQILKVDFDSRQDLRRRYGVTQQTSFVKVDRQGNKQSLWVGYGQDKSVDAILRHL